MRTAFFTICAANYIAFARVLMRGIARHHPAAARYVILVDEQRVDLTGDDFEVILVRDLALPEFENFCFRYDISELCTAVKPYGILELFKRNFDACIFIDPDVVVYGALNEALDALSGDGQAALTPHRLTPDTRSGWPNDRDLLKVGAYNLGFLAARRTRQVIEVIEWWARRLERECLVALESGLFVDQKWVDLWPSFCPGTTILRHPGYNVAYWNLGERRIERSDGGYLVNGEPLVFFHFSGVLPHRPDVLSKYQDVLTPRNIGPVDHLLQSYIADVLASGHAEVERIACSYSLFENGVPIPAFARSLFRRDETRFPNPYRTVFQALQWPSPEVSPNPDGIVSVAAHELWRLRADLQQAFPIDTPQGQLGLADWFVRYGCAETRIDPVFARPVVERLKRFEAARKRSVDIPSLSVLDTTPNLPRARSSPVASAAARRVLAVYRRSMSLQRMWRRVPVGLRARAQSLVLKIAFRFASPRAPSSGVASRHMDDPPAASPLRPGALLVGYPKAEMGVGQALRGLAEACREATVPFGVYDFGLDLLAAQADDSLTGDMIKTAVFNCNVFCVNADQWPGTRATLGEEFVALRYNILRPFWELAKLPDHWAYALSGIREIWAPTRFVADAFAATASCPIEIIPVPVLVKCDTSLRRASFGLPEERFLFLFLFDFASFITRKNPEGVVAAFKRAFPNGSENVGLVIKSHGAGAFADRRAWLAEQAADSRIFVIDRTLRRNQIDTLMSLADCFVSLHRSEGFGLGMAEAMALGKPVIGTDYSGNTDFLTEKTGFPVSYRLVAVAPGAYPGHEDQVWAEPDVEHAAWLMRQVVGGNGNAAERADAGRRYMAENHSAAAVGRKCRDRLARLGLVAGGVA
jgi:glycosyltransferase involved in cell wall biosynthesis